MLKYLAVVLLASQLVGNATMIDPGNDTGNPDEYIPPTWTQDGVTWRGNPFCKDVGMLLAPDSPAIGAGSSGGDIGACSAVLSAGIAPEAPASITVQ